MLAEGTSNFCFIVSNTFATPPASFASSRMPPMRMNMTRGFPRRSDCAAQSFPSHCRARRSSPGSPDPRSAPHSGQPELLFPACERAVRTRDGVLDRAAWPPLAAEVAEVQLVQRGGVRECQLAFLERGDDGRRSVLRDARQLLLDAVQVADGAAVVALVMRDDEPLGQALQAGWLEGKRPHLVLACERGCFCHGALLLRHGRQIVELDDRVGLGPHAEFAGI